MTLPPSAATMERTFYFCPETAIDWIDDTRVELSTPWLVTEIRLAGRIPALDRLGFYRWLPGTIADLPLVEARLSDGPETETHMCDNAIAPLPEVQRITEHIARYDDLDCHAALNLFCCAEAPRHIIQASRHADGVDPIIAFTRIRTHIFRSLASDRAESGETQKTATSDIGALIRTIHQAYYYTLNSEPVLEEGLIWQKYPEYVGTLHAYIREERGHHHLVAQALDALGERADEAHASPYARAAMAVLRWAAQHCPFAFAACLSLFEMGSFADSDPIANALRRLGHPKAAEPIERHFDINRRHGHGAIGFELVRTIPVTTEAAVCRACAAVALIAGNLRAATCAASAEC